MRARIRPRERHRLWLAVATLGLLFGCDKGQGISGPGTVGERARVEFSFQRSCFFGCPEEVADPAVKDHVPIGVP